MNYGPKPILINEWQHVSFIWDQVKYEVDKTGEFGQYILTGSVTDKGKDDLNDENSRHSISDGKWRLCSSILLFEKLESPVVPL